MNTNIITGKIKDFWNNHKFGIVSTAVVVVLLTIFLLTRGENEDYSEKYLGYDLGGESLGRTNTYPRYMERYARATPGQNDFSIDIFSWTQAEGISELSNFQSETRVIRTEEKSYIEYSFELENSGMYNMYIEYFPLASRGINIERSLYINGEIPFLGADRLTFQRVWGDSAVGRRIDNQGNEIRPSQIETPVWESEWFRDYLGYTVDPYMFFFDKGVNTIRLVGINEPMAIRAITLKAPVSTKSYSEYTAGINTSRYRNSITTFMQKIQGEDAIRRSDPSLYAMYDRSSGATEPASVAKIKLNMTGGWNWRVAGQWIEWDFDVPENGMYRFTIKGRQNYNRGFVSNRSVLIDGEIPCKELAAVPFKYDNKWQLVTFQDGNGEDMLFPLSRGKHSFRLEVTLGRLGELLNVMEESVFRLNGVYRKILVLTGAEPDVYRDYRIDYVYPEVITAMALESKILYKLVDDLTAYSGERSPQVAVMLTLARQLELFVKRPDKIPRSLGNFKGNISALGDSMLTLTEAQLDIDYIVISAADVKIPPVKENFWVAASHEIRSFFASFIVDYNNLGDVYKKHEDVVEIWMFAGRDQSNILKAMVDDTFTPQTNIRVNVKLVAADALMPAVVAGTGPDAALTVQQGDPVNFAVRKAAMDLTQFPGYKEIVSEFDPNVLIPFEFQGGVYALPETQYYHVMYYRTDIMEELEIDVPDTWDDLIDILPIIQKNNMNVGIPSVANPAAVDFSNFLAHLYQRKGALYNEEGSRTLLDTEIAIEAFDVYTKFYTHYKVPVVYDFVNRFRTGEIPLGFADYTWFNTLEVFAPEIRGYWGFSRMPGLKLADGSVDRSVPLGTLPCMMFTNAKQPLLAWEFLKWWVSTETQLRFGRELESVMGAAARYPTANYEAFKRLSWGSEQMAVLDEQRAWTVGTPEVPGGYFVSRHITNAVRRILNEGQDTRETLLDYTITINDELIKKRKEFGLE
jgi:ABC-type glycerol-3-phosphate transport system substrate-binding protein